jgi:adenosylmethionine-8-amino-7-oxononanoate aminotransferase
MQAAVEKTMEDRIGQQERALKDKYLMQPWDYLPALGHGGDPDAPVIMSADGVYIYDSQGRKLLDGPAGMWCMQTGYGRKEIADAVHKQMMSLAYASAFTTINPIANELAARIASKTPGDLNRIYFTTGGSTAVDSALRLCHLYNNMKGRPHKKHILARERGYHGSTFLASSITGKERDKTALDIDKLRVHFLTAPCAYHDHETMDEDSFCDMLIQEMEETILDIGPENVMCFIAEPIMGSGGVLVPPKNYLKRCWELTRKYDIIYISDEVVTAFGRLGHWFASEEVFGIVPDIITFAKGITSGYVPLGGFAVSDKLMEEISGPKGKSNSFSNGYTWSGSPPACAAALASWDIIEREHLLDHVLEVGPYLQSQLKTLEDIPLVGDVRGMGLMAAVETWIHAPKEKLLEMDLKVGSMVDMHAREYGVLLRPFINVCIMSPPLIITKPQIDDLVSALRKGLELTYQDLRREGVWED